MLKMKSIVFLLVVCFYLNVTGCFGEIFSSVAHIEESVRASRKLTEDLMTLARREKTYIPRVQQIHRQLKGKTGIIKKNPEYLISHPVRVLRFVREIYTFLNDTFQNVFHKSYADDLIKNLPTSNDVRGTITGLLRLQEAYNQSTPQVSQGIVANTPSVNLTASECYDIGEVAIGEGKHNLAREWLKEAWDRVPKIDKKDHIYILKKLANASFTIGSYDEAAEYAREGLSVDPQEKEAFTVFTLPVDNGSQLNNSVTQKNETMATKNFTRMCADENWVNPDWQDLQCYITDKGHPVLRLRPVKVEEVKKNPDVVVFHEFLSDSEIELIKFLTKSKLERSSIRVNATQRMIKEIRVSKGTAKKRETYGRNLIAASGQLERSVIRVSSTKQIPNARRVVNYGVGGYYTHHLDAWVQKDWSEDNRIATVLMYLSDVQAGGATVFPVIELKIDAKKGNVAFWHNLRKSNYIDGYTRHGACPVMVGSKWVANFWIHRYHNEFTRKCGLTRME